MSRYTITATTGYGASTTAKARNKDEVIQWLCGYIADTLGDHVEVKA